MGIRTPEFLRAVRQATALVGKLDRMQGRLANLGNTGTKTKRSYLSRPRPKKAVSSDGHGRGTSGAGVGSVDQEENLDRPE